MRARCHCHPVQVGRVSVSEDHHLRACLIQNLRRGRYELGLDARHSRLGVAAAFGELARAI